MHLVGRMPWDGVESWGRGAEAAIFSVRKPRFSSCGTSTKADHVAAKVAALA